MLLITVMSGRKKRKYACINDIKCFSADLLTHKGASLDLGCTVVSAKKRLRGGHDVESSMTNLAFCYLPVPHILSPPYPLSDGINKAKQTFAVDLFHIIIMIRTGTDPDVMNGSMRSVHCYRVRWLHCSH